MRIKSNPNDAPLPLSGGVQDGAGNMVAVFA
jgi:hypothetical protein